jgi:hypothetical protein
MTPPGPPPPSLRRAGGHVGRGRRPPDLAARRRRIPPRTIEPASSSRAGKSGNDDRADSLVGSPAKTPEAASQASMPPRPPPSRRRRKASSESSGPPSRDRMNGSAAARTFAGNGTSGATSAFGATRQGHQPPSGVDVPETCRRLGGQNLGPEPVEHPGEMRMGQEQRACGRLERVALPLDRSGDASRGEPWSRTTTSSTPAAISSEAVKSPARPPPTITTRCALTIPPQMLWENTGPSPDRRRA